MESRPTQAIDQNLKQQYHAICFNPERQQTLKRLTSPPGPVPLICPLPQPTPSQHFINNNLVNQYIRYVYGKYSIEDPIDKQFRLSSKEDISPSQQLIRIDDHTPERDLKRFFRKSDIKTTKEKLNRMKKSYRQDNSQILYSTQFRTAKNFRISEASPPPAVSKQICYRTREKIRFKTLTNGDRNNVSMSQHRRTNTSFQLQSPPGTKLTRNTDYSRYSEEVPSKFRYCPMCEEVVLEHNIIMHQNSCQQIKKAYQMPLEDLQSIFSEKIKRMKGELMLAIQTSEQQKIAQHRGIDKTLREWLQTGQEQTLGSLREQYRKMAVDQYYLLSKLDWFHKLKAKIVQQKHPSLC